MFVNMYVFNVAMTQYTGGWMLVAITLPMIVSNLAGVYYPILLLLISPVLASRWKAIIKGLCSITFKCLCFREPWPSCTNLFALSDHHGLNEEFAIKQSPSEQSPGNEDKGQGDGKEEIQKNQNLLEAEHHV